MGALGTGFKSDMDSLRAEFRTERPELRRQIATQFYWVLTFVLGSILIPVLRDFVR